MSCTPSLLPSANATLAFISAHCRYEALTPLMLFITELGRKQVVIFILALAYWVWNKRYARFLGYGLFVGLFCNLFLKEIFNECRPPSEFWLDRWAGASFPSGHAQIAVLLWGGLAYYLKAPWAKILCFSIGLAIAFSRVYLGVHYLHDVLAGMLIGALVLLLFIWAEKQQIVLLAHQSFLTRSLALFCLFSLFFFSIGREELSIIAVIGGFGFWFGCQLELRYIRFQLLSLRAKIAASVIGTIGIYLLGQLFFLFPKSLLNQSLLYFSLAFWISCLAPWCFHRFLR